MPKNEKYSAEQVADALLTARGLVTIAANKLGCTPKTVRRYIKNYKTVEAARDEAREAMRDIAQGRLFTAVSAGKAWAIKYYLSTQGTDLGYNPQLLLARELNKLRTADSEEGMQAFMDAMDQLLGDE